MRVGIVGARGYTGRELLAIFARHPRLEVAFVTSRELAGRPVDGVAALAYQDLPPDAVAATPADAYVLALPNGQSAPYVAALDAARPGAVIVDLSADHRTHPGWVYGLPERHRAELAGARRIANPGCYATAIQLAAAPWLGWIAGAIHGFGVSGYSGAGATPSPRNDPAVLGDHLLPYALVDHTHERELARELGREVFLLPHVAPFFRGLSVTVSVSLDGPRRREELEGALRARYEGERLVRVTTEPPRVGGVRGRHHVEIGGVAVSGGGTHAAVVACLDNLLGGAATLAARSLNLAFGLPELEGIDLG